MPPQDKIRELKEEMQDELSEEVAPMKRRELVQAINGLFDIMTEGKQNTPDHLEETETEEETK